MLWAKISRSEPFWLLRITYTFKYHTINSYLMSFIENKLYSKISLCFFSFIDHHTLTRISTIEAILTLLNNKKVSEEITTCFIDEIVQLLLEKYKINFNKRYFPDSLVSILQALFYLFLKKKYTMHGLLFKK